MVIGIFLFVQETSHFEVFMRFCGPDVCHWKESKSVLFHIQGFKGKPYSTPLYNNHFTVGTIGGTWSAEDYVVSLLLCLQV